MSVDRFESSRQYSDINDSVLLHKARGLCQAKTADHDPLTPGTSPVVTGRFHCRKRQLQADSPPPDFPDDATPHHFVLSCVSGFMRDRQPRIAHKLPNPTPMQLR